LIELLRHGDEQRGAVERVVVWGARDTLDLLPSRPWIQPVHERMLDGALPRRALWQAVRLPFLARGVDLLFAPGGLTTSLVRPRVVMSRNMLPFDDRARRRFHGAMRVKMELLRVAHSRSFMQADGVIFLTGYAQREVCAALSRAPRSMATIPHGVSDRFRMAPRPAGDAKEPFRLLYVSTVSLYKHQCELIEAVAALRRERRVELTLIGPDDGTGHADALRSAIARLDPGGEFLHYLGKVPFDEVHRYYRECDAFVFASSCENMPNILVEAMSSGLPIACAQRGPMPEVLGDAGIYFDPEDAASTTAALRRLAAEPALRVDLARRAHGRADAFSWERCARDTFAYLTQVAGR
jgi:glycosyltransferase involved in cell wall biosynthesis